MKIMLLKILASAIGVVAALLIIGWVFSILSTVATAIFVLALLAGIVALAAKRFAKARSGG